MSHLRKSVPLLVVALLLLFTGAGGFVQQQDPPKPFVAPAGAPAATTAYRIKLGFLYKFAIYIKTPQQSKKNVVIGVYGRNVFAKDLQAMARKLPDGRNCIPVFFSGTKAVQKCDILFFPAGTPQKEVADVMKMFANNNMVIVSEDQKTFAHSTTINFIIAANRVKMQLLRPKLRRRKLQITPALLKMMIPVDAAPRLAGAPAPGPK